MDTRNREFEDFCGPHLNDIMADIAEIHDSVAIDFFNLLKKNPSFSELIDYFNKFGNDDTFNLNYMAQLATLAFYNKILTRQQVASLLEYRSIKLEFPQVRIIDVFRKDGELSQEFLNFLPDFVDTQSQEKLKASLKGKKNFECCYFDIEIDKEKISDPRIEGTLQLANNLKAIHYASAIIPRVDTNNDEESKSDETKSEETRLDEIKSEETNLVSEESPPSPPPATYKVYYPGAVMHELNMKANYGENAKHLYPRLGIFDIDDIERSARKYGRYYAVDHPAAPCATGYHGTEASAFYVGLHDRLHEILLSTIPNPVYAAYLHLTDVIREKSGLAPAVKGGTPVSKGVFSAEIWDLIDMECGLFVNDSRSDNDRKTATTQDFIKMMQTRVYTERRAVGACPASAYSATTWLVMIDMVLNSKVWEQYSIDTSQLASDNDYGELYKFVVTHQDLLRNEASQAKQVARIQALWFNMSYDENAPVKFMRKENHIELLHDGKPMNPTHCSKKTTVKMLDANIDDFINKKNDNLMFEFINRVTRDRHEFNKHIHTYEQFEFILSQLALSPAIEAETLTEFRNDKIKFLSESARHGLKERDYESAILNFNNALKLVPDYDFNLKEELKKSLDEAKRKELLKDLFKYEKKLDVDDFDADNFDTLSEKYVYSDEKNIKSYSDNKKDELSDHVDFYDMSLHKAAFNGDIQRVIELLEIGYDPLLLDMHHDIPIFLAIDNYQYEIMNLLFNHMIEKALIKDSMYFLDDMLARAMNNILQDRSGDHEVIHARFYIMDCLLVKGAYLDLRIPGGWTPLLIAARSNQTYIVNKLLSAPHINIKIDYQDQSGWTALHLAASFGYPDMADLLLKRGADTTIKNYRGDNPIMVAMQKNNIEVFKVIFNFMFERGDFKNEVILLELAYMIRNIKVSEEIINLMNEKIQLPSIPSPSNYVPSLFFQESRLETAPEQEKQDEKKMPNNVPNKKA